MIKTVPLGVRPPTTAMLYGMQEQGMSWPLILGELIDNSLDAGATEIVLRLGGKREIHVIDNGVGCSDLGAMLVPGERSQHRTTKAGVFGIGLKDSANSLSGETTIITTSNGVTRTVIVNWPMMAASRGEWLWPDSTEETEDPPRPSGTEIRFRNINKEAPSVSEIIGMVGFWFSPALRKNRVEIIVERRGRRFPCPAKDMPALEDVIEKRFRVSGRDVFVRAGVVAENIKNDWQGLTIEKAHRVIEKNGIGLNGYSARRIAGRVELGSGFRLTKHKNEVVNRDELERSVFEIIEPLLKKAQKAVEEIALAELSAEIAKAITGFQRQRKHCKELRNKPEDHNGTHPSGEGNKPRRRARRVQPGDKTLKTATARGIVIDWADRIDHDLIADVNIRTKPPKVTMNLEHPAVKLARSARDSGDRMALSSIAVTAFAHAIYGDKQAQFLYPEMRDYEGFSEFFASAMRQVAESLAP